MSDRLSFPWDSKVSEVDPNVSGREGGKQQLKAVVSAPCSLFEVSVKHIENVVTGDGNTLSNNNNYGGQLGTSDNGQRHQQGLSPTNAGQQKSHKIRTIGGPPPPPIPRLTDDKHEEFGVYQQEHPDTPVQQHLHYLSHKHVHYKSPANQLRERAATQQRAASRPPLVPQIFVRPKSPPYSESYPESKQLNKDFAAADFQNAEATKGRVAYLVERFQYRETEKREKEVLRVRNDKPILRRPANVLDNQSPYGGYQHQKLSPVALQYPRKAIRIKDDEIQKPVPHWKHPPLPTPLFRDKIQDDIARKAQLKKIDDRRQPLSEKTVGQMQIMDVNLHYDKHLQHSGDVHTKHVRRPLTSESYTASTLLKLDSTLSDDGYRAYAPIETTKHDDQTILVTPNVEKVSAEKRISIYEWATAASGSDSKLTTSSCPLARPAPIDEVNRDFSKKPITVFIGTWNTEYIEYGLNTMLAACPRPLTIRDLPEIPLNVVSTGNVVGNQSMDAYSVRASYEKASLVLNASSANNQQMSGNRQPPISPQKGGTIAVSEQSSLVAAKQNLFTRAKQSPVSHSKQRPVTPSKRSPYTPAKQGPFFPATQSPVSPSKRSPASPSKQSPTSSSPNNYYDDSLMTEEDEYFDDKYSDESDNEGDLLSSDLGAMCRFRMNNPPPVRSKGTKKNLNYFQHDEFEPLSDWIVLGYDVYVVALQEVISDRMFDAILLYLNRLSNRKFVKIPFEEDKISGLGDGAYLSLKSTAIGCFVAEDVLGAGSPVNIGSSKGMSLNSLNGSKGAVAIILTIHDQVICFVSCHLPAGKPYERIKARESISRRLSEAYCGLPDVDPTDVFHHIIWAGDFNLRVYGLKAETVLKYLYEGDCKTVFAFDEFCYDEYNSDFQKHRYEESDASCFFPTYKKIIGRKPLDARDPFCLHRIYNINFKVRWYKGGKVKERIPSWTDRIFKWSHPELRSCLVAIPNTYKAAIVKRETFLLASDHDPVSCGFFLFALTPQYKVPAVLFFDKYKPKQTT